MLTVKSTHTTHTNTHKHTHSHTHTHTHTLETHTHARTHARTHRHTRACVSASVPDTGRSGPRRPASCRGTSLSACRRAFPPATCPARCRCTLRRTTGQRSARVIDRSLRVDRFNIHTHAAEHVHTLIEII